MPQIGRSTPGSTFHRRLFGLTGSWAKRWVDFVEGSPGGEAPAVWLGHRTGNVNVFVCTIDLARQVDGDYQADPSLTDRELAFTTTWAISNRCLPGDPPSREAILRGLTTWMQESAADPRRWQSSPIRVDDDTRPGHSLTFAGLTGCYLTIDELVGAVIVGPAESVVLELTEVDPRAYGVADRSNIQNPAVTDLSSWPESLHPDLVALAKQTDTLVMPPSRSV